MRMFFASRAKKPLHNGVRTGCHYLISLFVRLSVCLSISVGVCVIFVVFTVCESCTRPTSSNLGSMEAGEYGLTRETWVFARSVEVVAVASLLCIQ